jgi:uncharacterized membrane protein
LLIVMPKCFSHRISRFLAGLFVQLGATVVSAQAAGEPAVVHKAFLWRPFLAPFHAVVLHFPIGFLTMACVLELYRMRRPSAELKPVTRLTLWLSLLSGIVAATFGILRATGGGYESHELESHRWTGIAVVVATLLTLAVQRMAYRDETRRGLTAAYRGLLAVTIGLVVIAGHMGGNLTHGANYLTENAPAFVRELLDDMTLGSIDAVAPGELDENQRFFVEQVQPIFEKKCIGCHGPKKQKGEYRLDQAGVALAGGESGKTAIKPGDPLASELVRLILLPPGDDDVMPPEGKEPMNAEETLTIIRWIQKGAPFPAAASTSPAPDDSGN